MPANKHRGEVEIELGGRTFIMRPTFEFISEAEALTNKAALELLMSATQYKLKTTDIAAVIYAGCRAGGDENLTLKKVGELMAGGNFRTCLKSACDLLKNFHFPEDVKPDPLPKTKAENKTA